MICEGCNTELPDEGAMCPSCGRFVAMDRKDPPRDAGKSLAVVGITLSIPILVLVVFVGLDGLSYSSHAQRSQAAYDARTILPIAEKYMIDHPGTCPTIARLRNEKEISASSKITDPWDTNYQITCREAVEVRSFGPDRVQGTADDITESSPSQSPQ